MRKTFLTLVLFAFVIAGTVSAFAADFPTKPIEMQVAYAAGGLVDSMARAIAKNMEETLGQPVVVVNKPGAGGALGVTALKSAKPDGYTIGVVTGITLTYTPLVQKTNYSLEDFKYLASVGRFQEAFVAPPDKPYKNFKELVAYAKKNPGMTYASMNIIAENILTAVAKKEGIEWRAIPTKGGSEVMTAVVGKHVDFGFSGGIHPPFVKSGDMIVLAGLGKKRLLASPEVPTLIESGYDLFFDNDNIVFAPKGIPEDVAKKLTAAIEKAAKDPKYIELLQTKFFIPALCLTGEELAKSLQEGVKANQKFIDTSK
jgi:tripartite-type tricarboxylate transporter receptor subunit TctC